MKKIFSPGLLLALATVALMGCGKKEDQKVMTIHSGSVEKLESFCHERGAGLQEQFVVLYEHGKPLPFKYTAQCLDGTIFSLDV